MKPQGYGGLDARADSGQVVREVRRGQRGQYALHATADVDPDSRRRYGLTHGDDRADRRTLAEVDVRHHPYAVDPRQRGDVAELLQGCSADLVLLSPHQSGALRPAQRDRILHVHLPLLLSCDACDSCRLVRGGSRSRTCTPGDGLTVFETAAV